MSDRPVKRANAQPIPADPSGRTARIDLGEGEEILIVTQPHWLYIVLDRSWVFVLLVIGAAATWLFVPGAAWKAVAILALLAWVFWQLAERASRRYVLTSRRVVAIAGLLRQGIVDAPIRNVRQVTMYKSFPERVLGLGTLGFATAGTGGQDVIWRLVDRPGECFGEARRLIDPESNSSAKDNPE
ncbi:MAG: hypothetical protein Phyf2KO_09030 [Phycisphaerales bacterium]